MCIGAALGLIITSTTQAILGNVSVDQGGIAGGLLSTAQQLGGVLGTSVLGSVLVSSVGSILGSTLNHAGVHGPIAQAVISQKQIAGSGMAPISAQMPKDCSRPAPISAQMPQGLQQAITNASDSAFVHGLHTAMVIAAALAFAGALLGLFVQRGASAEPGHPADA